MDENEKELVGQTVQENETEQEQPKTAISNKTRNKWLIIALGIFLVFSTVGIGPVGINLYWSEVRKDEVGYNQNMNAFDFKTHSYNINYYLEKKHINSHGFAAGQMATVGSDASIELEVHEDITAYSGNYFTPFYKDYTVKYNAFMNDEGVSADSAAMGQFSAKVEGTLKIKVYGLCTISKAKEIARKEVENSVGLYINAQMSRMMNQ